MAKITLGKRPETFKKKLSVLLPTGETGDITVEYKYRTREEFAELIDDIFKRASVTPASQSDDDVRFSLSEALSKGNESNADYILQVAKGWDLDVEFTRDNVLQLCNELPGVAVAVIDTYKQACVEGRLGN